jgi:FtsZ-interacting cell division protein ZipA
VIQTRITIIIVALAIAGLIFSSATVFKPNARIAFGSESGGSVSESEANEIEKQSSSDEDKKKQLDDDEKKIQDDEKQVESDEKQVQADVVKLESDEKQIKIDLTQSETIVQGKGPQNPSIQQSLEASKQQQPNPGNLATPPHVLAQYSVDQYNLKLAQQKLASDVGKLQADENNYATHINALAFNACKQGETSNLCIR